MTTLIVQRTDTSVPVTLSVSSQDGPVTGETCFAAIRDGSTADRYLDFDDLTFKTVGWITKKAALLEIFPGIYALSGGLNVSAITNLGLLRHMVVEYEVGAPTIALAHDTIVVARTIYDIPTGVWDEPIAGHLAAGSTGRALSDAGAGGSPEDIANAVWSEALPGGYAVGSAGATVPAIMAAVDYIRKISGNRLEVDLLAQKLVLWDDDHTTVLQRWPLETNAGEPVATQPGVQTKRKPPEL